MYKYIVFDFDGTLINSNDLIEKTIRAAAREVLNRELKQEEVYQVWGKALREQMADLDEKRVDELSAFYSKYYRDNRDDYTDIFPGIKLLIEQLYDKGYKMGIVTNKGSSGLEHGLEMFGLSKYFEITLAKTDVVLKKPHPEGLFKVMNYFGAKAEECLYVGDSIHDIIAGRNAGMDTVLVNWTIMDLETLKKEAPTYCVDAPDDILNILVRASI